MARESSIEWTNSTWNIITGCSIESPGCTNCYAMKLAGGRLQAHPSRKGLTQPSKAGPVWTGEVRFNHGWLKQPRQWKRPRMIFVCAHGDLFHEDVADWWLDQIFDEIDFCWWHVFQILTKRSDRMRSYFQRRYATNFPGPHIWAGVSVENQEWANKRIPDLMTTPALVRWLSCEPLLGPIEHWIARNRIHWVVVGGESGAKARPMHPDWARSLRDQCAAADVAFFMKQMAGKVPIPEELMIRELPRA